MVFDYSVCEECISWQRHKDSCPYKHMSLLQYCDYKNIPYQIKKAGREIRIDTSNLMNSSSMIELNKEIKRTRNNIIDNGYDYKVVK